jgi:hypothetical protein
LQKDGKDPLKVITSVGTFRLERQVLYDPQGRVHSLPSNTWLPPHQGVVLTQRAQEWACLLGRDFPFPTAQRLLGWLTGEANLLCINEVQRLVVRHGQALRQAAAQEVQELLAQSDLGARRARLVPTAPARRPAAWAAALEPLVAAALAAESVTPPAGVTVADWERVRAVRRAERAAAPEGGPAPDGVRAAARLSRLGPELAVDQVLVSADEVKVRQPEKDAWAELRTARVATAAGARYVCGTGSLFLQELWLVILLGGGRQGLVTFLCDGARWLREFAEGWLSRLPRWELILDWFHLVKKVRDLLSRTGGSRAAKQAVQQGLLAALWDGKHDQALARLEEYRALAKHEKPVNELRSYLEARAAAMPHYRQRRMAQQYIGSGQAEKTNDLLVARRQKNRGMHWRPETSEALARLKVLQLNGEWDAYWHDGLLPSLVAG